MNYQKHYDNLINRAKKSLKPQEYTYSGDKKQGNVRVWIQNVEHKRGTAIKFFAFNKEQFDFVKNAFSKYKNIKFRTSGSGVEHLYVLIVEMTPEAEEKIKQLYQQIDDIKTGKINL